MGSGRQKANADRGAYAPELAVYSSTTKSRAEGAEEVSQNHIVKVS